MGLRTFRLLVPFGTCVAGWALPEADPETKSWGRKGFTRRLTAEPGKGTEAGWGRRSRGLRGQARPRLCQPGGDLPREGCVGQKWPCCTPPCLVTGQGPPLEECDLAQKLRLKCPSPGEGVNKMWSIPPMEHRLATKGKEVLVRAAVCEPGKL